MSPTLRGARRAGALTDAERSEREKNDFPQHNEALARTCERDANSRTARTWQTATPANQGRRIEVCAAYIQTVNPQPCEGRGMLRVSATEEARGIGDRSRNLPGAALLAESDTRRAVISTLVSNSQPASSCARPQGPAGPPSASSPTASNQKFVGRTDLLEARCHGGANACSSSSSA